MVIMLIDHLELCLPYSLGTFTLSNLGMFGVDRFDAILPPGQVSDADLTSFSLLTFSVG